MKDKETKKLLEKSSDSFLDLLKNVAEAESLVSVTNGTRFYFARFPDAASFIADKLPGILLHHYPPLRDAACTLHGQKWLAANTDWAERIKAAAAHDHLPALVGAIVAAMARDRETTKGAPPPR